jgi:heme oxygenase|eukprot:Transcript_8300.p2 GENE.Transcript_8300~~Transcript_8300.p2  ORF type:complete len:274 (-),score=81.07 Transcript_8300:154-975(-)
MGSFAKAISQLGNVASARLAAPAAANTSRGILQHSAANKRGLSLLLDQTLKSGHDMKTFGLGTAASMASVQRYTRFTAAMRHIYGTMEKSLDGCSSPAIVPVWKQFGDDLRREPSLTLDLADVTAEAIPATPATQAYCAAIEAAAAADDADGGGRLIGHLYCRYFADLFGGQMLAAPTRYALGPAVLPGTPRHYYFGEFGATRRESIEQLYEAFNVAGDSLGSDAARQAVVDETNAAFAHNVAVYTEEGALWSGAARGVANMVRGYARAKLLG